MSPNRELAFWVSSIPPIMSQVMQYLTAKQLNCCRYVCKLWRRLAETELKRRVKISWYFDSYCSRFDKHSVLYHCSGTKYTRTAAFADQLESLAFEPELSLVFISDSTMKHPQPFFHPADKTMVKRMRARPSKLARLKQSHFHPVIANLLSYFPQNGDIGFCSSFGIFGRFFDRTAPTDFVICPALSAVFFPQMFGVSIHKFEVSDFRDGNEEYYSRITGIPPNEHVKCLLFYFNTKPRRNQLNTENKLLRHYLNKECGRIAVGGVTMDHFYIPRYKAASNFRNYCIAFAGDNVKASSLYLSCCIQSEADVSERLKVYKESDLLRGHCIAFMFTCKYIDTNCVGDSTIQSRVFRMMFPSVPLFGAYADEILGTNFVPNEVPHQDVYHGSKHHSATLFILLSICY